MTPIAVVCPHYRSDQAVIKNGKSAEVKQRFLCHSGVCQRCTLILNPSYRRQLPAVAIFSILFSSHQTFGGNMLDVIKRIIDITVAVLGLLLVAPLLLSIAVVVFITMGCPVLFVQPRPGKEGDIFKFYKFRTMTNAYDADGKLLSDAQRLTGLGKILRKTSLDELPQLWNVLRGEMSLVGPRPLLVKYLDYYTPEQARRHTVRPGITGLAQISGRNSLSWEEKFKLDVWYVDHWSLWLDLKILGLTVIKVLQRDGISQASHVTMSPFEGTLD